MRERVLIAFLDGRTNATELAADLADAYEQQSQDCRALVVEGAEAPYVVTRNGLLRVCDAVLESSLDPALLEPIGDCLMMSETLAFDEPDERLLADVAHCWSSPEICYLLDQPHVAAFRTWLKSGRNPLV